MNKAIDLNEYLAIKKVDLSKMINEACKEAAEEAVKAATEVLEKREKLTVQMIAEEQNMHEDSVLRWIIKGLYKSKDETIKLRATKLTDGGKYSITRHDLNTFLKETGRQVN